MTDVSRWLQVMLTLNGTCMKLYDWLFIFVFTLRMLSGWFHDNMAAQIPSNFLLDAMSSPAKCERLNSSGDQIYEIQLCSPSYPLPAAYGLHTDTLIL